MSCDHSPLPWSYGWDGISGGWFIPELYGDMAPDPAHGPTFATEANAQFIVTAANCHADLLEACKEAQSYFKKMISPQHPTTLLLGAAIAKATNQEKEGN